MEWLKRILGDNYNKISQDTLNILKSALGENTEYIVNDPTKVIPKNVFNEKIEKIKLLETQITQYQDQLKQTGDMVTSAEMKTKLETQKVEFENLIKQQKQEYEKQIENDSKKHLIQNTLTTSGCIHPDLIMDKINLDDVIVKDGKILNSDKLILPLKESYKAVFNVKITGGTPPSGGTPPQPQPQTKEDLIKKYNEAEKAQDFMTMQQVSRKIKEINTGSE